MKFLNTKAGLALYDAECKRLDAALERAHPAELRKAGNAWMDGHDDALTKLRAAFYEDTKRTNSPGHCAAVTVSDMRSLVTTGDWPGQGKNASKLRPYTYKDGDFPRMAWERHKEAKRKAQDTALKVLTAQLNRPIKGR